jgi:hypothetical protein
LEEAIRREKHLYEKRKRRPFFQKTWNDKMKGKRDQRKKGFKPTFFKNNSQVINKGSRPKMNTRQPIILQKVKGKNLYNVGDVSGITYIGTSFTKVKG